MGDTLEDDGKHHKKKEIVLDGTENWILQNADVGQFKLEIPSMTNNPIICTHFGYKLVYSATDKPYLRPQVGYLYAEIGTDMLPEISVEAWEQFLAEQYANGTPVKLVYELATEQIVPYNSTQQTQYEAMQNAYTYADETYIESTSDELSPILNIQYIKRK